MYKAEMVYVLHVKCF